MYSDLLSLGDTVVLHHCDSTASKVHIRRQSNGFVRRRSEAAVSRDDRFVHHSDSDGSSELSLSLIHI